MLKAMVRSRGAISAAFGLHSLLMNSRVLAPTCHANRLSTITGLRSSRTAIGGQLQNYDSIARHFGGLARTAPATLAAKCKTGVTLPSASALRGSFFQQRRFVGNTELCSTPNSRGLVLGVYANEEDKLDIGILTENAAKYNEVSNNV